MFSPFLRALRTPFVGVAYLSFALGGGILGTFLMPCLHLWPGSKLEKQRRCQALTGLGFRLFHWYLHVIGVMSYRPPALEVARQIERALTQSTERGHPRAVMVVANHPTLVDTTAIMASYPYLVVVAKSSVFHFPLLRLLFRFCGHTAASADLGGEAVLADQLIERLKNGESVLLFPESTRSPDGGPRPFRRGPFEIALRAGVPIQPIAVDSGPGLLKGGLAWYNVPPRVTHYGLCALQPHFPARKASEPGENSLPTPEGRENVEQSGSNQSTPHSHSGRQLAQLVFDQISSELHKRRPVLGQSSAEQVPASSGSNK